MIECDVTSFFESLEVLVWATRKDPHERQLQKNNIRSTTVEVDIWPVSEHLFFVVARVMQRL